MRYEKEKYERLISESFLFSLDREKESIAFKRESYRMIELLYCYLLSINKKAYEPYGCEITEVAVRCIKNFDYTKGIFLHYFNAAWKKEYKRIFENKAREEKYRGIKITEEDQRAVRKYIRLADKLGSNLSKEELYQKLSKAMCLPVDKIRELAQLSELSVASDTYIGEDGNEQSIWEIIPGTTDIGQIIEDAENFYELLRKIDKVFCTLQKRQKLIVSDLITIRICPLLEKIKEGEYSFISSSITEKWRSQGRIPTQREIAQKYGRCETSVGRTIKEFCDKVKKEK